MGLFLHFGPGDNLLPEPWRNLPAAEHDIRRPLLFDDGAASCIHAEHLIEHVSFLQGLAFLEECRRVLEPGGVLRLAFPDVGRFVRRAAGELGVFGAISSGVVYELNERASEDYAAELERRGAVKFSPATAPPAARARGALRLLLKGYEHQAGWTEPLAAGVLLALGFRDVRRFDYGAGELGACDGHHKDAGRELAEAETTVFEARK